MGTWTTVILHVLQNLMDEESISKQENAGCDRLEQEVQGQSEVGGREGTDPY